MRSLSVFRPLILKMLVVIILVALFYYCKQSHTLLKQRETRYQNNKTTTTPATTTTTTTAQKQNRRSVHTAHQTLPKRRLLLTVGVLSKRSATSRRTAIRETWFKECKDNNDKVVCMFFTASYCSETRDPRPFWWDHLVGPF